ncbi:uncharacterized protein [Odocoileus virginianus]|uniref:Uncharacterized protein n=1 Tax=Odocoileus virginianus TaxID=9874 RepID=A0ABM4J711_ODOVR
MPLKNPPAIHRPTQRCPPCWGDKWKQQPPLLLPLQPPGLGGNVPPGFPPPSAVDPLAGGGGRGEAAPRSRGPGAGEARPGAALTSSTGRSPRRSRGSLGEKREAAAAAAARLLRGWGSGFLRPRLAAARGGRTGGGRKLAPSARVPSPESGSPSAVRAREFAATSPGPESRRRAAVCLGPGRWVREERAQLTSAAVAAGRVAPSGQWGNGKECGGFKQNSMSLPGCCQTAGLPRRAEAGRRWGGSEKRGLPSAP